MEKPEVGSTTASCRYRDAPTAVLPGRTSPHYRRSYWHRYWHTGWFVMDRSCEVRNVDRSRDRARASTEQPSPPRPGVRRQTRRSRRPVRMIRSCRVCRAGGLSLGVSNLLSSNPNTMTRARAVTVESTSPPCPPRWLDSRTCSGPPARQAECADREYPRDCGMTPRGMTRK